jgi:tetratricopeptide (TPR) repeat protein
VDGDNPRLLELRRRVQADPASIAFAQLAEECRRAGNNEEAVSICRAGLAYHHDYLSARVTLGRALTELGFLDDAQSELTLVLSKAPDNLAANRAMAEIFQQRGQLAEALTYYKAALQLAQHDPDLEHAVERIEQVVSPPPPKSTEAPPPSIEDLFDFDTLLAQLGGRTQPKPDISPPSMPLTPIVRPLADVELPADDSDPFALLEKHLRESDEQRPHEDPDLVEQRQHQERVIADLEHWLEAIVNDRDAQAPA